MKINVNKKLVATLLAGTMAFTLVGCGSKGESEYKLPPSDIEINYVDDDLEEVNNEINNEEANVNLLVANLPDNTRITLNDGTSKQLNEFSNNNSIYQIPSSDFTLSFESNDNTYSYNITGKNNETISVSTGVTSDNKLQFNIQKNTPITFEELQDKLSNYNIKLDNIYNNSDINTNIIERNNRSYTENNLTSEIKELYVNNVLINQDNNNKNFYSPLRIGEGVNNIEIIDNETVKLSYERTYTDSYQFIENIENNANYFFNNINNTKDVNYFKSSDYDFGSIVNEDTTVTERIERFYHGENVCNRYYYSTNGNNIIEFGQVNYDNEYFLNDPNNLLTIKSKNNSNNNNDNSDSDYVHYYSDDYKVHGDDDGNYVHYYSDDNQVHGDDGPYVHYYSDDNQVYGDDGEPYVHYYSDDDFSIYNENYDDNEDIYEYEEEYHKHY